MWTRHAIVLLAFLGCALPARAQQFTVQEVSDARRTDVAQIKPGTIVVTDHTGTGTTDSETALTHFDEWAEKHPTEKKFLTLFPAYTEPTVPKLVNGATSQVFEKLYIYVAEARFVLDRPPGAIDLSRYVTLGFLQKIDPAITHQALAPSDIGPFNDEAGTGNVNPDRQWCTGRTTLICIQSSYKLEGKIPMGILLVNKLREGSKKVADHIDFQSELSALDPSTLDQAALQELTTLNTPVSGVLEQNLFYVNQILKFAKFFGVFQAAPNDDKKTVVTAFMAIAIKASVLDEKRGYENMPVLRNLVPAQVLMGQSSFNSGSSISAGLPIYARNEIKTIAGILQNNSK
jgi:hypothetical protein